MKRSEVKVNVKKFIQELESTVSFAKVLLELPVLNQGGCHGPPSSRLSSPAD